ncbi:MAG TPA: BrnT family toxin [Alphaproteobacteria bacterium]|nr:BrnT family toxin [Alphaproteobacteria bacterium]
MIENRLGDVLDPRDYGEVRRIAYGLVEGRLFVCVYTMRSRVYRLISV